MVAALPSVSICPLTTTLRADAYLFRVEVEPSQGNGLRHVSQIAVDKIDAIPASRVGKTIGHADNALMLSVERVVAVLLGIA